MLEELVLENYVLFEKATLAFTDGFTVISGQTGAGKSLIAGAISLALGGRASPEIIRSGSESAEIRAVFSLPDKHPAVASGLLPRDEDQRYIFERIIRDGKSNRFAVNAKPFSSTSLKDASELLIDIAAQNEHTRLIEPAYQRELLDRFGKLEKEAASYAELYHKAMSLYDRLRASDSERERIRIKLEQVRFHLKELDDAGYNPETDADLDDRIRLYSNAAEVRSVCEQGEAILYEDEDAIQNRLGTLIEKIHPYRENSAALRGATDQLDTMLSALDEAVRFLREATGGFDISENELDEMVERSERLRKLARRLDCTPDQLPEKEEKLRQEEENLAAWETDTTGVRKQLHELLKDLATMGQELCAKRIKAGKKLGKAVDAELADLDMPQANFSVTAEPQWSEGDDLERLLTHASSGGLEEIIFRIAPNPGETASSLAETASGGESSRTMLALKTALSDAHSPPVLFFDEIDAGIGGRLGDAIARKLKALSRKRQVIAITHLPQVAASADRHLAVAKHVNKGRTATIVRILEGKERLEEIAAMIRGEERTDTTRAQAKEMMKQHGSWPQPNK